MKPMALVLALALILAGCSSPPPEPSPSPTSAATASPSPVRESPQAGPAGWKLFTAQDGSFEVLLPGPAEADQSERATEDGELVDYSVTTSAGGATYSVEFTQYPDEKWATRAHEERLSDIRAHSEGRLLSEEKATLDGVPGLMFVLEDPKGDEFHNVVYRVGNRLYDILVVPKKGTDADAGAADRLVESFKFKS